jgi:hypothetical protein
MEYDKYINPGYFANSVKIHSFGADSGYFSEVGSGSRQNGPDPPTLVESKCKIKAPVRQVEIQYWQHWHLVIYEYNTLKLIEQVFSRGKIF